MDTRETLLVIHRCLERLDFTTAALVLQSALKQEVSKSLSFMIVPYLLFVICESTFYSMDFETLSDVNHLHENYGKVLSDVTDVTAVMDTVASYNTDQDEVFQAKFISTLLKQVQVIVIARRQVITTFLSLIDQEIIPNFKNLANSLIPFQKKLEDNVSSPLLTQHQENLISEIEALSSLFMTQHFISKLVLADALCYLYKSKSELESWNYKYVHHDNPALPLKTGFFSWARKLLSLLSAKLCFYFPDSFLNDKGLKAILPTELDFLSMTKQFVLDTECVHFSLLRVGSERTESQRTFKTIFCFPQDKTPVDIDKNILFFFNSSREYINNFENRELYYHDEIGDQSFYLQKAEHHICLALVFNGKKDLSDPVICGFLSKLRSHLRFWNLFTDV